LTETVFQNRPKVFSAPTNLPRAIVSIWPESTSELANKRIRTIRLTEHDAVDSGWLRKGCVDGLDRVSLVAGVEAARSEGETSSREDTTRAGIGGGGDEAAREGHAGWRGGEERLSLDDLQQPRALSLR
jgi:hypothetical protein